MGDRLSTIDRGRKHGAAVPFLGENLAPSNTMWFETRSTSVPGGMLISTSSRLVTIDMGRNVGFGDTSPYPTEGEAYIRDDRSFYMMRCNMKTIIRRVGQVRKSHARSLSSFSKFSHHPVLRCLIALKIFSSVSPCDACFLYDSPPKFW